MALHWKLVVDCAEPLRLADFWAFALGYDVEDHSALIDRLLGAGVVTEAQYVEVDGRKAWVHAAAVRHPDDPVDDSTGVGLGRRLLFQAVPDPTPGKNKLHLDVHAEPGHRDDEVSRLQERGAKVLQVVSEPGTDHVVMTDPEGNVFCVQ